MTSQCLLKETRGGNKMNEITLEDISKIKCASNIQLSPDTKHCAYVVTVPNYKLK